MRLIFLVLVFIGTQAAGGSDGDPAAVVDYLAGAARSG